jgi:hypothetical protein
MEEWKNGRVEEWKNGIVEEGEETDHPDYR